MPAELDAPGTSMTVPILDVRYPRFRVKVSHSFQAEPPIVTQYRNPTLHNHISTTHTHKLYIHVRVIAMYWYW